MLRLLLAALLTAPTPAFAAAVRSLKPAALTVSPVVLGQAPLTLAAQPWSLTLAPPGLSATSPLLAAPLLSPAASPSVSAAPLTLVLQGGGSQTPLTPATVSLADLVEKPELAAALFEGLTGKSESEEDRLEFARLVGAVYGKAPGEQGFVSPSLLRKRLSRGENRVLKAVLDLPKVTAEGMVRVNLRSPSPKRLRESLLGAGWTKDKAGEPVADAVVIGGGPAGLSTALQAADLGAKVVLFEAGYLAQSFSDAGMKAVYRMRTNSVRNSLVQEPFSAGTLVARLGLLARLAVFRALGRKADAERFALDKSVPLGNAVSKLDTDDPMIASARVELLQHFSEGAEEIERLGSKLVEKAPVSSVRKRADGLWEVKTSAGHVQLARKLVLAQGQVGAAQQNAKDPAPIALGLPSGASLVLGSRADLDAKASLWDAAVRLLRRGRAPPRTPIVHDSLLGMPEIREYYSLLPAKTAVAVVGSGESAAKSVMDLLRLNPRLVVHLFVKEDLAQAQLQIPQPHAAPDAIKRAQDDPKYAQETLAEWKAFGTPITPDTYADLQTQAALGKVVIHALGEHFDARPQGGLQLSFDRTRRVVTVTQRGRVLAKLKGGFVWAAGYDRAALRQDPLTASLEADGLLKRVGGSGLDAREFEVSADRLSSAKDASLYIVGAQNFSLSADSAIPGAVARAARVAGELAKPPEAPSRFGGGLLLPGAVVLLTGAATSLGPVTFDLVAKAAFWTANILAFVYLAPQVYRILKNRSADVSLGTATIGLVAASVMTLDFAHLGQGLMTYRNLAQAAGFAAVLGLKAWYDRRPGLAPIAARPAALKTAGVLAAIALTLGVLGPAALALAPGLGVMNVLLVPFQMLSGLGFTWLMMPQFEKIARDGKIGDASRTMAWGFVGTRAIWIWSLAALAAIPVGAAAASLLPLGVFAAASLAVGGTALHLLRRSKVTRWKGFLALAAVMALEVLAGWLILPSFAPIPDGQGAKFLMYLCYLVQNSTAFLAAIMTARAFGRGPR